MSVSLSQLSLADAVELGSRLRTAGEGLSSMEEVGMGLVRLISEAARSETDEASCVLVRCFVTVGRSGLPTRLARLVALEDGDDSEDQFLVLLATEGIERDWCDRRRSRHHQVIPLVGSAMSVTFPMISRMFRQFGCPLPAMASHGAAFVEPADHAFGVFHVEEARGSTALPNQDFITEYGVASVVGVGGRLPTGDVFAVIMFSREPIDQQIAQLLQPLAMSIKLALLPVCEHVFASEVATQPPHMTDEDRLRVEVATLRTLLTLEESLISHHHQQLLASGVDKADTNLTNRERDILELLATGATNKQIAANLDLRPGTVKWHIYNLFRKLGVETRTEAAIVARQRGLVR
jgi:DNA-binding CsgD family transcriptional regulator